MTTNQPKVTFGFVNCNRLFYLKSCVESLLYCTEDYKNKELIIIDNASVEPGTEEYLLEKEEQGFKIIRQQTRDPANEFAKALNIIARESTGDFVCPLQSDMQFLLRGEWLKQYVEFYQKNINVIGCILLDAQRGVTNTAHEPYGRLKDQEDDLFLFDIKRNTIAGAGDMMYSRAILDMIYPWSEKNESHEGGPDSETKMLNKAKALMEKNELQLHCVVPIIPPAAAIYTDARGTNARVRKNKRYGDYWPPKEDFMYYKVHEYKDATQQYKAIKTLFSIETIAEPIGWSAPIDSSGSWKKNPLRPETAEPSDYTVLYDEAPAEEHSIASDEYLSDWLES